MDGKPKRAGLGEEGTLPWFLKLRNILQDADSKPNSDWFGNFDDLCQGPENSKQNSVWLGKVIE